MQITPVAHAIVASTCIASLWCGDWAMRLGAGLTLLSPPQERARELRAWFTSWADVLREAPDPSIVTDADGRDRMTATGLPWEIRDRMTGIVMLLVPPGEYLRGAVPDDPDVEADMEGPQHRVRVSVPFYLARTEVTQAQWHWVMGDKPSENSSGAAALPVERVSFERIRDFLAQTQLELPRDSEWEYACRAGTTGVRYGDADAISWNSGNSGKVSHPVALKEANPWGFHDMLGNVWEFVGTKFADYSEYSIDGTVSAEEDDTEKPTIVYIIRGGSFGGDASFNRASKRAFLHTDMAREGNGLRVAKRVPDDVWRSAMK